MVAPGATLPLDLKRGIRMLCACCQPTAIDGTDADRVPESGRLPAL
jgi:hypothetical protein